jgi:hypothetical protein
MKKKAFLPNWFVFDGWLTRRASYVSTDAICDRCGGKVDRNIRVKRPVCDICKTSRNREKNKLRQSVVLKDANTEPLGPKEPDMV